jgi:hypothetical protein
MSFFNNKILYFKKLIYVDLRLRLNCKDVKRKDVKRDAFESAFESAIHVSITKSINLTKIPSRRNSDLMRASFNT